MKSSLFFIILVVQNVRGCPDRWALHKVDVWAHRIANGPGQHKNSTSIYELDNYEMIVVKKANVSVLCDGMIKNFSRLKYLSLIEANTSRIQPGAFQNLPLLTHLSLSVNHLTSIERYQFQNLQSLKILYLSNNQIENVDRDAFDDLVNLRRIYLDRNRIHEIDRHWFMGNKRLSLIDLSFNNISKLQSGAFTVSKGGNIEIRLQKNEIEEVEKGPVIPEASAEEGPSSVILRLDYNNLTDIGKDFVQSMSKDLKSRVYFNSNSIKCFAPETLRYLKEASIELHAEKNPLSCDCLEAATNFANDNELRAVFKYSSTMDCQLLGFEPNNFSNSRDFFGN